MSGRHAEVMGDRRGAALVLALWVLLVLGMASLEVLAAVRGRVDAAAFFRARTVGRYAAESGVEATRALLDRLVREAASPPEQAAVYARFREEVGAWGPVPIGTGRYQVAVEDLNGRIDLNRSRPEVLLGLIAQFVSTSEAEDLVLALRGPGALADVGDPDLAEDPGADFTDQDLDVLGDAPSDGGVIVRHLEELARVPGFTDSLVAALAPYVTVSGDAVLNVNSASEPALAAIPYVGEVGARSLIARREAAGPLASRVAVYSALAEGGLTGLDSQIPDLSTTPRRVLVVVRGWEDGYAYSHEIQAVFEVLTSSLVVGSRLRLRSWAERAR